MTILILAVMLVSAARPMGAINAPPSASRVARATTVRLRLNITDAKYSAKCDGASNDTAAIQAALNDIRDAGGGAVFIPKRLCVIGPAPLVIYSNTVLEGDGLKSRLLASENRNFTTLPLEAVPTTSVSALIYVANEQHDISIHDIWISGRWRPGLHTTNTHNILLGTNSHNCSIIHVKTDGAGWSGILARGFGHVIERSTSTGNAVDGIEIWGSDIRVLNNTAQSNGDPSVTGGSGIEVTETAGENVFVSGNTILRCRFGITASFGSGATFSSLGIFNNTIREISGRAIEVGGGEGSIKHVTIKQNKIDRTSGKSAYGNGITISRGVSDFEVVFNRVYNTNSGHPSGIAIEGNASDGLVANNFVKNTWVGVSSNGIGANLHFRRNSVKGWRGAPYVIKNGTADRVPRP